MPDGNGAAPAEATAATPAQTGATVDPYRNYNFKLEVHGVTQGHFTQCSGLSVKVQSISYREGGEHQIVRRLPGQVEYGDVALKYGVTTSREMWQWFLTAVQGKVERRDLSVILLDSDSSTEVARWNLSNAWVSEWRGAPLDAMGNEVAVESMKIVYESLEKV